MTKFIRTPMATRLVRAFLPSLHASLVAILATLVGGATVAVAADQAVPLPEGEVLAGRFFAAATDSVAVALRPVDPDAPSRVMQVQGANVLLTDLPGKILSLTYSFDGKRLLAVHKLTEAGEGEKAVVKRNVSLIDASGALLWTKADTRTFEFSTTGDALFTLSRDGDTAHTSLEVFDLKGNTLRTIKSGKDPIEAALVLGDGKKVLLAEGRTLTCQDLAAEEQVLWRYMLARSDPDIKSLFSVAPDKIVLGLDQGRFKVFSPAGTAVYEYDPELVALGYGGGTEAQYRQYSPTTGVNPCSVTIFDGSPSARVVALSSGMLYKKFVSLDAPGYKLIGKAVAGKLLFEGEKGLLIRSLKDDFKETPQVETAPIEVAPADVAPAQPAPAEVAPSTD